MFPNSCVYFYSGLTISGRKKRGQKNEPNSNQFLPFGKYRHHHLCIVAPEGLLDISVGGPGALPDSISVTDRIPIAIKVEKLTE